MTDLRTELGRQRIMELRAIAASTPASRVILPDGVSLMVRGGWDEPYVMLTARELLAMLEILDPKLGDSVDK